MTPMTEAMQTPDVHSRTEAGQQARRLIEQVLSTGQDRLDAELARLRSLGVIDESGRPRDTELPPDMRPGAERDFGG